MHTTDRLASLMTLASECDGIKWAERYGEPGYDAPDKGGILFADWNTVGCDPVTPDNRRDPQNVVARIGDIAEKLGIPCEWSDEWTTCECGGAVRTSPDSHGWQPSYVIGEGDILCRSCCEKDPAEHVDSLLDDSDKADTFGLDLAAQGFRRIDEGESGFHPGQNDNPRTMVEAVPPEHEYVFQIDGVGQFDMSFSLWVRPNYDDGYRIERTEDGTVVTSWEDRRDAATVDTFAEMAEVRAHVAELKKLHFRRLPSKADHQRTNAALRRVNGLA